MLLAAVKVIEVTSFKTPSSEQVQSVIKQIEAKDHKAAYSAAESIGGVGGAILRKGVENADEKRGTLEEILYEKILAARPKLERFLPFMALTAAAAWAAGVPETAVLGGS